MRNTRRRRQLERRHASRALYNDCKVSLIGISADRPYAIHACIRIITMCNCVLTFPDFVNYVFVLLNKHLTANTQSRLCIAHASKSDNLLYNCHKPCAKI